MNELLPDKENEEESGFVLAERPTFKDELTVIAEIDTHLKDLYTETKSHLDIVKSSRAPGSLHFVSEQTKHLTAILASRATTIGHRIGVMKSMQDAHFKDRALGAKSNTQDQELALKFYELLIKGGGKIPPIVNSAKTEIVYEDEDIGDQIEKRIMELQTGEKISSAFAQVQDENQSSPEDESPSQEIIVERRTRKMYMAVREEDGYAVDWRNEYTHPGITIASVKISKKTGEIYAIDDKGFRYPVVEKPKKKKKKK